jgi:hypothetical protein
MQLENLCMLRIYGPIWTSGGLPQRETMEFNGYRISREIKDLKEPPCTGERDGTWQRRGCEDKGGSINSPCTRKIGGKPESNATISIPCRMHNGISRRKRRFEITVSTNTKKGFNAGEARGRNRYFGHAKAVRCRNCQIGSSRTGTPTLRSGGYNKYQESRI